MIKRKRLSKIIRTLLIVAAILIIGFIFLIYYTTNVTVNLDSYTYELPFQKGTKCKVIQGYGGMFTHRYVAAIDFEMPVGTPVCAARAGIVYAYKDSSDEGGILPRYKNKANFIIIKHDDGSFGCYWHLQKDGVLVKQGRVEAGQQIGLSGGTGQVWNPHLHFSVKRQLNYQMNSFVRTKFRTTDGVIVLKNREIYERPRD